MKQFEYRQVDVFSTTPLMGNPLAVVLGADGLSDETMARFANWTNLSETTFLLTPTMAQADYRLRIFTPSNELPFAGHPTLGSCHAWLDAGGIPKGGDIVQECAAGLIRIRRNDGGLAFAAPPLVRSGSPDQATLRHAMDGLSLRPDQVIGAQWIDNGPGWLGLLLKSRADVLAIQPDYAKLAGSKIGIVAPWSRSEDGDGADFEVRAFTSEGREDPVTGSLNASIAMWLIGSGLAPPSYVAAQGTRLGRAGRVQIWQDGDTIWVGGEVVTCITGQVWL
ncbi:PhzF family phenazine biosynthesis protein [Paracoccus sp. 11-3]|uniref:PhzF family phenazine biosynthesis protein n=1 Tax=Paracoccus amoyensis TaxID=2760093 RepID=A0A926J728_9RHOB|nr:PhzF family phenazine biosynthesis protein [Paracoccus amoyensis]MBC9247897.1 PhzF family phenazine biosynthesis protein [Paracoccus amoyensis]